MSEANGDKSALIYDIEQTTEILFALQQLGFNLTIDDFGTGYSTSDYQTIKSINELAHRFGLKTVTEDAE